METTARSSFVFGAQIIGGPLALVGFPGGDAILEAAGLWILLGQVNLYRRVNECFPKARSPLHAWWALLPPPADVVVGLRRALPQRILEEGARAPSWRRSCGGGVFPLHQRATLHFEEFARTPSMWFWFTKDWDDFDVPLPAYQLLLLLRHEFPWFSLNGRCCHCRVLAPRRRCR